MVQGSTNLANVYTEEDIGSASLYVYFGDNQAETRPVNFGLVKAAGFIAAAVMQGKVDRRFLVTTDADPRTETSAGDAA